jgi:hypothetical protein
MIYIPNPKALVYNELNFISSIVSVKTAKLSIDCIFDDVSQEIYNLFIASPGIAKTVQREKVSELLPVAGAVELLN